MKLKELSLIICQANLKDSLGLSPLSCGIAETTNRLLLTKSRNCFFTFNPFLIENVTKSEVLLLATAEFYLKKKINCFRNPYVGVKTFLHYQGCAVLIYPASRVASAALKRWNLFCFIVGLVNKFLSASYWIPLSRLTYSAYLLHPIVMNVYFGSFQHTTEYTDKIFVSSFNIFSLRQYLVLMLLL